MDAKQREEWNARVPSVTVLDRCNECEQLKPNVQKRQNYWPTLAATCCSECWARLIAEHQGVAC